MTLSTLEPGRHDALNLRRAIRDLAASHARTGLA